MYKLTNSESICRLEDGVSISMDEGNADYQAYQAWVLEGNTPEAADVLDPKIKIQVQLEELERATMMNRLQREFMIVSMQDLATRQAEKLGPPVTAAEILAARPGWVKLQEVEAEAIRLRGKLV